MFREKKITLYILAFSSIHFQNVSFTFNVFKSSLTEAIFSRKKNLQENSIKIIRAKNTPKIEEKLYRNNFSTLEITDNRLRISDT